MENHKKSKHTQEKFKLNGNSQKSMASKDNVEKEITDIDKNCENCNQNFGTADSLKKQIRRCQKSKLKEKKYRIRYMRAPHMFFFSVKF